MKLCANCQQTKPLSEYYIRNKKTGNTFAWCKQCLNEYSVKQHNAIKVKAVEYMGGHCKLCGYDRCKTALVFHHLDPNEKDFGIAQNRTRNWDKIVKELDKCVLLCGNCHAEVHAGLVLLT